MNSYVKVTLRSSCVHINRGLTFLFPLRSSCVQLRSKLRSNCVHFCPYSHKPGENSLGIICVPGLWLRSSRFGLNKWIWTQKWSSTVIKRPCVRAAFKPQHWKDSAFPLRSSSAKIKDCEILQIWVEPDCVRAAFGLRSGFVRRISATVSSVQLSLF